MVTITPVWDCHDLLWRSRNGHWQNGQFRLSVVRLLRCNSTEVKYLDSTEVKYFVATQPTAYRSFTGRFWGGFWRLDRTTAVFYDGGLWTHGLQNHCPSTELPLGWRSWIIGAPGCLYWPHTARIIGAFIESRTNVKIIVWRGRKQCKGSFVTGWQDIPRCNLTKRHR
jgi:hypothetical protein